MDTASAAVGLFNGCLHAYRAIAQATEIGAESMVWDIMMRIELTRFEAWGRILGFLDEKTGSEISDEGSEIFEIADILQIEAARHLVRDILVSLTATLEEFKKAAERYRVDPASRKKGTEDQAMSRFEAQLKRTWASTKDLGLHLVLVMKDKDKFKSLIQKLRDFNNGLDQVLSVGQKAQSAKALTAKVLAKYDTPHGLDMVISANRASEAEDSMQSSPQYESLVATAKVKKLCILNAGKGDGSSIGDYRLPDESVQLDEPPRREESEVLWPYSTAEYKPENGRPYTVLVEWRLPTAGSAKSKISAEELKERRNHVVALLQEISHSSSKASYRILGSIGWLEHTGQVEDKSLDIIGFASRFPKWADKGRPPVSLYTLLNQSFDSEKPSVPSLGMRFQIAKDLSVAMHQLQCSQWLHRTLSSHQVVFFYDDKTAAIRFDSLFLIGLQYSRPDDQFVDKLPTRTKRTIPGASESRDKVFGSLREYIHPRLWDIGSRRYRRSDDVYSLGIILLEVALWIPAKAIFDDNRSNMRSLTTMIEEDLAAEVGDVYHQAVTDCLDGLDGTERSVGDYYDDYDGEYKGEDPEYGLESEFLWKVVRQLEQLKV